MTSRGYQAFPWESWRSEFAEAEQLSFQHIEWVLDEWSVGDNPLLTDSTAVTDATGSSGVDVISVCADCFMSKPLDSTSQESLGLFDAVVAAMQNIGATHLILPCVDEASLLQPENLKRLRNSLDRVLPRLQGAGVEIAIEADLAPEAMADLVLGFDCEQLGVNYDIGNSAHFGYDPSQEFDSYGRKISVVHVKDRLVGGPSVPLGSGSARFALIADHLAAVQFNGVVTMQSFRDEEGLNVLKSQLRDLEDLLSE